MEKVWIKHYEDLVSKEIEIPDLLLTDYLETMAKNYPDRTATIFMGAKLTYQQLNSLAASFAVALMRIGVNKGDRVAIHLPNCPQFVLAYYGILKIGGILVPTNPLYVDREIEKQLNDSGASVIITLTKFYPVIERVRKHTKLKHVIVTNIKDFFPPVLKCLFSLLKEKKDGHRFVSGGEQNTHTFLKLLQDNAGQKPPSLEIRPDELACLMYTGGTTGISKGAMLTNRNILSNALQVKAWLPKIQEANERILSVVPLFHSYGMTTCLNLAIVSAASMVLLPQFIVKDVLASINRYRPTLFPGVPTMYIALINHPEISKYDLRSISACISGAAALPVEVQTKFEQITGGRLVEGYGLSEASPVTHANPIFGLRKAGSIGLPFPNTVAKVVSLETGEDLPVGEIGELVVQGPQVMQGYWNNEEETKLVLKGSWLFTGDLAKMDEDGYFYIVDRKKDMIIAGGYNIYPRDIEEVLYTHPKIQEALVISAPHEYLGETVKAFVVLKPGEEASAEEIIQYCSTRLAKYKVPKMVEFRDSLPKTLIGKILRRVVVEEERKKYLEKVN